MPSPNGEHSSLPEIDYTDVGPIIDGVPQIIPTDGWYWLQVGLGLRCQWHICYIEGFWVKSLIEVWHWSDVEFHNRHKIGPRLEPPGPGAPPFIRQHSHWEH